jgi:ubiquinone/menaquinone biosynthesis C-methylase UbiE
MGDFEVDRGTTLRIDALEQRAARQFLEAVDPKSTDCVLDAGCGTGVNIAKLSGLVADIVGMDLSEEMIKRAEHRINAQKITNVKLVLGNVTKMEFPSDAFNKVICTSVLQYLNEDEFEAALQEMVRVCKDGGTIVIHAKNRTSLYGLSRRIVQFIARLLRRKTTPDYYRPRFWYERVISKSGGQIVDYDSHGIFTFVPLPRWVVHRLLQMELRLVKRKSLKRFGVNYKMTVRVDKKTHL